MIKRTVLAPVISTAFKAVARRRTSHVPAIAHTGHVCVTLISITSSKDLSIYNLYSTSALVAKRKPTKKISKVLIDFGITISVLDFRSRLSFHLFLFRLFIFRLGFYLLLLIDVTAFKSIQNLSCPFKLSSKLSNKIA
jgi:hypothetical protein